MMRNGDETHGKSLLSRLQEMVGWTAHGLRLAPAQLAPQKVTIGILKLKRRIEDLKTLEISILNKPYAAKLRGLRAAIEDDLVDVFGKDTIEFDRYSEAADVGRYFPLDFLLARDRLAKLSRDRDEAIELLTRAVRSLEEKAGDLEYQRGARTLQAYNDLDLHPRIAKAASDLYRNGHYSNAIEDSVKALNALVRERSGEELDGNTLMERVFSPKNPILRFNNLQDESDSNEQRGFMMLFSGAVAGLRNPRAHKIINDDPERALEFIAFVSLLAKLLESTEKTI